MARLYSTAYQRAPAAGQYTRSSTRLLRAIQKHSRQGELIAAPAQPPSSPIRARLVELLAARFLMAHRACFTTAALDSASGDCSADRTTTTGNQQIILNGDTEKNEANTNCGNNKSIRSTQTSCQPINGEKRFECRQTNSLLVRCQAVYQPSSHLPRRLIRPIGPCWPHGPLYVSIWQPTLANTHLRRIRIRPAGCCWPHFQLSD